MFRGEFSKNMVCDNQLSLFGRHWCSI